VRVVLHYCLHWLECHRVYIGRRSDKRVNILLTDNKILQLEDLKFLGLTKTTNGDCTKQIKNSQIIKKTVKRLDAKESHTAAEIIYMASVAVWCKELDNQDQSRQQDKILRDVIIEKNDGQTVERTSH